MSISTSGVAELATSAMRRHSARASTGSTLVGSCADSNDRTSSWSQDKPYFAHVESQLSAFGPPSTAASPQYQLKDGGGAGGGGDGDSGTPQWQKNGGAMQPG